MFHWSGMLRPQYAIAFVDHTMTMKNQKPTHALKMHPKFIFYRFWCCCYWASMSFRSLSFDTVDYTAWHKVGAFSSAIEQQNTSFYWQSWSECHHHSMVLRLRVSSKIAGLFAFCRWSKLPNYLISLIECFFVRNVIFMWILWLFKQLTCWTPSNHLRTKLKCDYIRRRRILNSPIEIALFHVHSGRRQQRPNRTKNLFFG